MARDGKRTKKKRRIGGKVFLIILLILCAFAGSFTYRIIQNGGGWQGLFATALGHNQETLKNMPEIKFVFMGESEGLTDTIMVCGYNPKTQSASVMSIPRDTFVGTNAERAVPNDKINAKYSQSPEEVVKAINKLTGLEITNYLVMDTNALVELVDAIGGVWFNVPIDMKYDDYSQDLHIDLKAGYQLLDGEKAEQVVRFRHNNSGTTYGNYLPDYGFEDIGRMKTQREFITEVIKQVAKPQNIFKINQFLEIAKENLKTNMEFSMVKDYAPYVINFNTLDMKTGVLPGKDIFKNITWIYLADEKETSNMVTDFFINLGSVVEIEEGPAAEVSSVKVEIVNRSGTKANTEKLKQKLKDAGYKVVDTSTDQEQDTTIIYNRTKQTKMTQEALKELVGLGELRIDTRTNSKMDFTIVIGKDYTE